MHQPWLLSWARISTLVLGASLLGYAGRWHWLLDLCAHFRWQYSIALPLGALAALLARKRALALLLALGCWLNAYSLLTASGPVPAPLPGASAPSAASLSLLVVNVHVGMTNSGPLLALIERESPDVIGIVELSPEMDQQLAVLDARYPFRLRATRDDPFGIGLWSRLAGSQIEAIASPPLTHPSLHLQFAAPAAGQLWLTHPFPPISAVGSAWRDRQLEFIADQIGADPNAIVAGDFNATPWSAAYRDFRARSGLFDSAAGRWPWPTWFAGSFVGVLLAVPIDHVLHGRGWQVLDRRVCADIGSDHRPVLLRLAATDRVP